MNHQDNTAQHTVSKAKTSSGEKLDLDRWASLVADGQVPFPKELPSQTQEVLGRKVSRLRRLRLLRFIARTIALDIHRSREP